jgi:hypothetical protein
VNWLWFLLIAAALAGYGASRKGRGKDAPLTVKRRLLVVPLILAGEQPTAMIEWAARSIEEDLEFPVDVGTEPIIISKAVFHPTNGQANAVTLVEIVETLVRKDCAVLALTEYDLFSPVRKDLAFAMGARKGCAGLISTYRMEDQRKPDNSLFRLRKMLIRYGAELVCDAQRETDPRSVLYEHLHKPEQLDIMEWPPPQAE